jgi:mannose-6-phosphate isomerase-like protein (cupin superfamily)
VSLDELPDYQAREALLRTAFTRSQTTSKVSHPLDYACLIDAMREQGSRIPELAHLYFAGAVGDHPYFLKTDRIALGLSVLPEDADKAGAFKRHPHQNEVVFVLDGELVLDLQQSGQPPAQRLSRGDVRVIEPGWCHRYRPVDRKPAVYLFVKTNPDLDPREELCGSLAP